MRTKIIAGFPGCGKSTAAIKLGTSKVIDLESSDYHWIYDNDGNKKLNPKWPENYVIEIIRLINNNKTKYICISTHSSVLVLLTVLNIKFKIVMPYSKEIYMNRYKLRGSSEEFISNMDKNWDSYIHDLSALYLSSKNISLMSTDKYISEIIK